MNWANGAQTTLVGAITAGAIQLTVASAALFPAVPFHINIDKELMTVTAVAGTAWTVTRGIESSTAAAHASGSLVTCVVTAGDLAGFGSGGSTPVGCKMHLAASVAYAVSATYQKVLLDTVDFDTLGTMADTMNHRINVVQTGYYAVAWVVGYSGSADGTVGLANNSGCEADVLLNAAAGGAIVPGGIVKGAALSGGTVCYGGSTIAQLTAGDFIALEAFMGNDTGFLTVAGAFGCALSCFRIG